MINSPSSVWLFLFFPLLNITSINFNGVDILISCRLVSKTASQLELTSKHKSNREKSFFSNQLAVLLTESKYPKGQRLSSWPFPERAINITLAFVFGLR